MLHSVRYRLREFLKAEFSIAVLVCFHDGFVDDLL
jgi:hypothetical protein